jgi:NitT/TauT family transport system ATP-binding protein
MVFQSYTLFPWLTIEQNIRFGLRERGMPEAQQKERAATSSPRWACAALSSHFPKQLSGGMQQRTAIARALANDPKILLMDEPFGALDNQTRVLMQELLLGIWEAERKTVLFVTHDIDEAIFMANRVAVFSARPGRIKTELAVDLAAPAPLHVKTSPEFMDLKARLTEEIRAESGCRFALRLLPMPARSPRRSAVPTAPASNHPQPVALSAKAQRVAPRRRLLAPSAKLVPRAMRWRKGGVVQRPRR